MEVQFRPYSLCVVLPDTTASSITLVDTEGTALECNYISVVASGDTEGAFYRAAYGPAHIVTPLANFITTSGCSGIVTSGIVGSYASTTNGVVEFLLSDSDRTSTLQLQTSLDGDCTFYITYGQIQGGSLRRDNLRPIGS